MAFPFKRSIRIVNMYLCRSKLCTFIEKKTYLLPKSKLAKEINGDFLSYLVFYTHQNTHAMYHLFCEKQSTHNDFEIVHRSFLSSRN